MIVEPWLRGTLTDVDAVRRQVLHALELTLEDGEHWCAPLTDAQMNARPFVLAPVAFHLRHIARSLDRLLTYVDGARLTPEQHAALASELAPDAITTAVLAEFRSALASAETRIRAVAPAAFEWQRHVGRQRLPTTVAGLLIHCAEHSQRHIGQAIVTAKVVTQIQEPPTGRPSHPGPPRTT